MPAVYRDFFGNILPQGVATTNTVSGGSGAEPLSGTAAADLMVGGGAGHVMSGGAGDDTYQINIVGDAAVELGGEGIDTAQVRNLKLYTLSSGLENLYLFGKMTAFGNDQNNLIVGNIYAQTIAGGGGNDVIVGGSGADTFVFGAGSGYDVVTDFTASQSDKVRIQDYGFMNFAQITGAMTQVGADVVLQLSTTDAVKFLNKTIASFQASDFQLASDSSNLNLSFHDEFDTAPALYDPGAGTGTWTPNFSTGDSSGLRGYGSHTLRNNGEKEIYVDPAYAGTGGAPLGINPFSVSNGVLDINARATTDAEKQSLWYYKYASGLLTTAHSFAQTYGYFEIKAQLPTGQGVWPAFWLLPTSLSSPPELDVVEQIGGNTAYFTSHSTVNGVIGGSASVANISSQFHTYGVLWTNKELTWYVDGTAVFSMPTPADMNKPMYMLVNLAVGGSFPGNPPLDFASADLKVDYIRAYTLNAGGGVDGDLAVMVAKGVVGGAQRGAVGFTVTGLDAGATGVVTFLDSANHSVVINISANGTGVADLSAFADGPVTVTVAANGPEDTPLPGVGQTFTIDPTVDGDLAVASPFNVGAADRGAATFTVSGLDSGYAATLTFTDVLNQTITAQAAANGDVAVDLTGLADGVIKVGVTESDGLGGVLSGAGGKFALDTTADDLADLTLALTPLANAQNHARVTFNLVGLDKDAAAVVTFSDGAGHTASAIVNSASAPFIDLSGLLDGQITATIAATDDARNGASGAPVVFTLDTTADALGNLAVTPGAVSGSQAGFTVTGLDADATALVTLADGAGHLVSASVAANGAGTADISGFVGNTVTITIVATDAAGNGATGAGATLTLDQTADVGGDLAVTPAAGSGSQAGFTVSGLDADATALVTFADGAGHRVSASVAANGAGTTDISGLVGNTVTISIVATDAVGNGATGAGATLTLDKTADVGGDLAVSLPLAYVNAFEKTYVPFAVSGLDSDAAAVVTFIDCASQSVTANISANGAVRANLSSLAPGAVSVSILATDAVGNTAKVNAGAFTLAPGRIEPLNSSLFILAGAGGGALYGTAGDDRLVAGAGNDVINGGAGNNTASYDGAVSGVTVALIPGAQNTGGSGLDTLTSIQHLIGSAFADTLTGNAGANILMGGDGADSLKGLDGDDILAGGAGNDTLNGGAGVDVATYFDAAAGVTVTLGSAAAQNTGGSGIDTLSGIENLTGSRFNDVLTGSNKANTLDGGAGDDVLIGDYDADILYGGAGADRFVYVAASDSKVAVAFQDQIMDFNAVQNDKIDLSLIDANVQAAGDNAFTLVGAFTHVRGQLISVAQAGGYLVQGDTNGDAVADFAILVHAAQPLTPGDFIL